MAPLNEAPVLVIEDNVQQLADVKPIPPPLTEEEPQTFASEEQEEVATDEIREETEESSEAIENEQDAAVGSTLDFLMCCVLPSKGNCNVCKKSITFNQSGVKLDEENWSHSECELLRHTSATKLQAKTRGNMGRAEANGIRGEKRRAVEEASAVKLQAVLKEFLEKKRQKDKEAQQAQEAQEVQEAQEKEAQIKAQDEAEAEAALKAEVEAYKEAAAMEASAMEEKKFMTKIRKFFGGCGGKSSTITAVDTEAHKVAPPSSEATLAPVEE